MKERGILFSAAMVRAILDGRKTQTRRTARIDDTPISKPAADAGNRQRGIPSNATNVRMLGYLKCDAPAGSYAVSSRVECPYGYPGDRLWVRETWRSWSRTCDDDGGHFGLEEECSPHCNQTYVAYRATPRIGYRPVPDKTRIRYLDESSPIESDRRLLGPWRPSIFMPRWASRITLEIAEVSVHRLQEISGKDAIAEGVDIQDMVGRSRHDQPTPVERYAALWDSINGTRAPWSSNPWVWCLSFRVMS